MSFGNFTIIYSESITNDIYNTYNTTTSQWTCQLESPVTYALGIFLCIGGMVSYFPQYIALLRSKQEVAVSELSLLFLNIGSACLACNSLILNFYKFQCYHYCNFWLCSGNLLAFFQICVGWIIVFPLYLIFVCMQYKFRNISQTSYRKCFYELSYIIMYCVFLLVVVLLLAIEKFTYNNVNVFDVIAYIFGIMSTICCSIVWIPQIIKLVRKKDEEGLSLIMFLIQTPGNAIIIVFQAILSSQNWSTWIAYVFNLVEQLIIVVILIVLKCVNWKRRRKEEEDAKEFSDVNNFLFDDDGLN